MYIGVMHARTYVEKLQTNFFFVEVGFSPFYGHHRHKRPRAKPSYIARRYYYITIFNQIPCTYTLYICKNALVCDVYITI